MKKRDVILVIVVLIFGIGYNLSQKGEWDFFVACSVRDEGLIDKSYPNLFAQPEEIFTDIKSIKLENPAGSVFIQPAPDNRVTVKADITIYHKNKGKAAGIFNRLVFHRQVKNRELRIGISGSRSDLMQRSRFHFYLSVPPAVDLKIVNKLGHLTAKGIQTGLNIDQTKGYITLKDINGAVDIECNQTKLVDIDGINSLKLKPWHSKIKIQNVKEGIEIWQAYYNQIQVTQCRGLLFKGSHSDLQLKNIQKEIQINNAHAQIHLQKIEAPIRIEGTHCSINLAEIKSDDFFINNSYDEINVNQLEAKNIHIFLKHGKLDLSIIKIIETIDIQTLYSPVTLRLPGGITPTFNINALYGKIINQTKLPLTLSKKNYLMQIQYEGSLPEININGRYSDITLISP